MSETARAIGAWILMAALLSAQQLPDRGPAIRAEVPLVLAPVSVTERNGAFIEGLSPLDFELRVDGKARQFRLDTADELSAPVSLVVAVQSSEISTAALAKLRKVGSLIDPLVAGEGGEAAFVTYDDEVKLRQDFTSDPDRIENAFRGLQPADATGGRMIDAVETAIRMLARCPANRRRVMLVIGESRDRGSQYTLDDAVKLALKNSVAIYTLSYSAYALPFTSKPEDAPPTGPPNLIGIFTEPARLAKVNAAEALAKATGGDHESFLMQKKIERTIARMGREIHEEYVISFPPEPSETPGFHAIEVKVAGRPHAVVRARTGYWLTSE